MKSKSTTSLRMLVFLLSAGLLASCGGSSRKFHKSPVDELIRDMPAGRFFSVILNDMDVEGSIFETYKHQYKIIQEVEPGKPEEELTGWYEVDEHFFNQHVNDMGMEIASRGEDGKLHKTASPPGYNNYVGNDKYGHWQTNSHGQSFWAFYGQYAFMSQLFNMMTYPAYRPHYTDYRRNYYGTGRSYYGPTTSGRSYYGTNSAYTGSTRPNSSWSKNNSNFKRRVASRTSRSSSAASKSSRSASRYSSSRSRSRGGRFGK